MSSEGKRLQEARDGVPWRAWGPYLSERQWGTVREDYSDDGNAWSYLSHDQARSRAYHWGEDGLAGISDEKQYLCLALALWNGRDPIIKERLFGLTNAEGNHGEDVKEYYFYVDNLPTHSYQRWLYKYPHAEFPYGDLVETNKRKSRHDMEYELLDTGVFDDGKYFDVEVEHVKLEPEDILCRITVHNRSTETASLHLLPTLWFRNTWSWAPHTEKPTITRVEGGSHPTVRAEHSDLGALYLYAERGAELLFCENETNNPRVWGTEAATRFPKDGINDHVVHGAPTVNPANEGTKVAARVLVTVAGGDQATTLVRLTRRAPESLPEPFADADSLFSLRRAEADEFYGSITPPGVDEDAKSVMRQALAGMLWSKQTYYFDLDVWLQGAAVAPAAVAEPPGQSERVVVPHGQPRRHLDAGQVGVPLVRGVGSRLPLHPAGDGRPRLREEPAARHVVAAVPASERPDARLRVELRRREPACARVRDALPPQRRARDRHRRHRVPQRGVHAPHVELPVVGEPQGPGGTEPLRGRVSSASTTSACSTAARSCRPAEASNRPMAPHGWRCSARTCSSSPSRSRSTTLRTKTSC